MNGVQTLSLTATGDLMFYGPMQEQMLQHDDLLWGFRPLGSALLEGDLLWGNFETPITHARQNAPGAPDRYYSPPGIGRALREYGFDAVNLANNHIYDFGAEGVEATLQELTEAGLPHFGIGRTPDEAAAPCIVTSRNGVRVGFLGYTTATNVLDRSHAYVCCFPDLDRVRREVGALREQVAHVVVSCHTGAQHNPYPAPEARRLARVAMESGASLYLGHHPHVPQGCERIGSGLAVYSLGDFVTPPHREETRRTFFVRATLTMDGAADHELVPCLITDACQTEPARGTLRDEIAAHLDQLSTAIADGTSDELHYELARGRFFSQYVRSWIDEVRRGGPRALVKKFGNLRGYHLALMFRALTGPFRRRKGNSTEREA